MGKVEKLPAPWWCPRASPPPIAKRPGGKGSDLSTRRPPSCREFYPSHVSLGALPPLFSR